jgi:hypothetical protein
VADYTSSDAGRLYQVFGIWQRGCKWNERGLGVNAPGGIGTVQHPGFCIVRPAASCDYGMPVLSYRAAYCFTSLSELRGIERLTRPNNENSSHRSRILACLAQSYSFQTNPRNSQMSDATICKLENLYEEAVKESGFEVNSRTRRD